jgi:hypothetical protein
MIYRTDDKGKEIIVTCAEPPPDVGETFAKALAAQLEVSAPTKLGDVKVGGEFAEQVATAIAPLMVRSQGLQVLRDSAYTLCIDRMNGWISSDSEYMRIKEERFKAAMKLIEMELPTLPARTNPQAAPKAPEKIELTKAAPPQPTAAASAPAKP